VWAVVVSGVLAAIGGAIADALGLRGAGAYLAAGAVFLVAGVTFEAVMWRARRRGAATAHWPEGLQKAPGWLTEGDPHQWRGICWREFLPGLVVQISRRIGGTLAAPPVKPLRLHKDPRWPLPGDLDLAAPPGDPGWAQLAELLAEPAPDPLIKKLWAPLRRLLRPPGSGS
jgi:hypothetical protein